ncbi:MAG: response regulator [Candidatus Viridilinea halotolerans]|uniref:Circadian input-output histidine kinase CikA n=1 Tax=Candidatus Viridilinea halotolerans TaxID=2491704 RepID=A0A426TWU9_9CHLR|nr:MAG: response regulator [Candidatus Viridilinea halotolerans]
MLPDAAMLALVAQHTTNSVIITDEAGLIAWVNPGFTRITGYELDAVRGRKPGSFLQGPGTDRATVARIRAGLRAGLSFSEEILNYRKDGTPFWVTLQISPVFDQAGQITRFVGIGSDISERHAAEVALRHGALSLKTLIAALPIMLFATDVHGHISLAEGSGFHLLDLDSELIQGRSIFTALAHVPELLTCVRQALVGEHIVSVIYIADTVFEVRCSPLLDQLGVPRGVLCAALDVTQRMHATQALIRARDEAEAATRAKSVFLATMSHEIRTPLNAVIGMAGLLLDTPMSGEQRRYAETIRTSGDMLLAVINDILDFSKIEAGNMDLEHHPFDPRTCVEEVIELLAPRAAEKGLRLASAIDFAVPERLISDVTRVRQILVNLVGNAVKFTNHGEVLVKMNTTTSMTPGVLELHITVSDTGMGIPEDRQMRLFQPFSQMDASTTRRYGGTGLGLAICKRLCDLMGGRIEVASSVGAGATFSVRLPVSPTNSPPRQRPASPPPSNGLPENLHILLAEDNAVNQQVAMRMLERLGLRADLAANGYEAIAALERQAYDVVLMDVQMPEMDGLEATRHLRTALPAARQPYIIAMTAGAMVGDREACLAAGMNDYISKPVQRDDLLAALLRAANPAATTEAVDAEAELSTILDRAAIARLRSDLGPLFAEDLVILVETYRHQLCADVAAMIQAAKSGDMARVALLAHRLRGASATLGAQQATQICLALEQPNQPLEATISLIEQLLAAGERAAVALDQLS